MTVPVTTKHQHDKPRRDGVRAPSPVRILSVVGVLLLLFVIFAPQAQTDESASFSSYAAAPGGTRALYEVLARLGFHVSRSVSPLQASPDSGSVYVILKPSLALSTTELSKLVRGVSRGAIVIFTAEDETLADSLGFGLLAPDSYYTLDNTAVAGGNPPPSAPSGERTILRAPIPINAYVGSIHGTGNRPFLWLDASSRTSATERQPVDSSKIPSLVRGHSFGHGYAIAIAPSQIVANQALRDTRPAIAIVQAILFACGDISSSRTCGSIVFDEYHHGFGSHADMIGTMERALTDTAPGRMTLGFIAAALMLLLAFAVRPLAPESVPPISRRSPLEHVGALAHAYSQTDARKLGTLQLLRGLRRRHPLGMAMSIPDSVYLSALRERIPGIATHADHIAQALLADSSMSSTSSNTSSHTGFAAIGEAFANIERAFAN